MKKFLSLVLSLAMTLSLVTISASATDYDDLTDKGEVQYEEAVAVLNKLGIITGYEDGSFKPTGALTRGAAAKIIVSLMIGADAAANLSATAAPYKDVAVTNTFAAVISYCKTAHYIDGYTDGTFRPTAALSGSAFSKMLLGALGYDGSIEHFTGSGWTMNVAKLSQKAGLFNDFATAFKPNDTVDRESACLLALNTLKATEVEYTGSTVNVKTGDAQVTVGNTSYSYVTNNNSKINANIKGQDAGNNSAYLTLQFGEEHFTDLKLTADGTATDDFGRPSNQWSYKNVKIGTYALTPDYSYTTEANGDTKADKVKDMGLKDFKVSSSYYTVNGKDVAFTATTNAGKLEEIADLTANGVLVEAYLDDDNADTIESFVLVYTQLMKINTVKSTEVTLKTVEDTFLGTSVKSNYPNVSSVTSVKDDDDAWTSVKDLKADDYVLIVPVKDGSSYRVFSAAAPQTATGSLSNIKVKSDNTTVNGITVAGTAYKMSKLWTSEDKELTGSTKINSSTDTTVYLDAYGYAIYVKDVTASNSAIIIDEIYSSLSDGKIVKYAKGWDSNGNELSLNLGTNPTYPVGDESAQQGKVYEYETSTSNSADYKLVANKTVLTQNKNVHVYAATETADKYVLSGASSALIGTGRNKVYFDANVKFIFVSKDDDGDVTGITVNNGVTEVGSKTDSTKQYPLSYIVNKDGDKILAVVIPNDDDAANTANLLYFQKVTNHVNNADSKRVAMFTAYINGEKLTDCQLSKDVTDTSYNDCFFTYSKNESTGVYTLSKYIKTNKITSVYSGDSLVKGDIISDTYFTSATSVNGGATGAELNAKNAQVIDLYTDDGVTYSTLKEMKDALNDNVVSGFTVSYIYNGSDNSGSGSISYLFITANKAGGGSSSGNYAGTNATVTYTASAVANNAIVNLTVARASFVPTTAAVTVTYDILVNGVVAAVNATTNVGAGKTTYRDTKAVIGIEAGDTVTIDVTGTSVSDVNVLYVDKDASTAAGKTVYVSDGVLYADSAFTTAAPTTISRTASDTALTFYVKSSDHSTVLSADVFDYTANKSGTDTKNTVVPSTLATYTKNPNKFVLDDNDITASVPAGNSAVVVEITGLSKLTEQYTFDGMAAAATTSLTALGYTGDNKATIGDYQLSITANALNTQLTLPKNAVVTLTAELDNALGTALTKGLKVNANIDGQAVTFYFANTAATKATATATITLDKSVEVKPANVTSITDTDPVEISNIQTVDADNDAKWSAGDTITFNFSAPVVKATFVPTATASSFAIEAADKWVWNSSNTSVTIKVTTAPTTGDGTLTVPATLIVDATSGVTSPAANLSATIANADNASSFNYTLTLA
ncbi:putative surface layer protein [Oscillibacter valericigenes Sjm18-20]|nr:putative surface layer protein [Oscillibacter valericigenes Sjm18-20]